MSSKKDATVQVSTFIDELGEPEWQEPCSKCLQKFRSSDVEGELTENEVAACVVYFVAVANLVGGPSEAMPFNPKKVSEIFGVERQGMLSAYAKFVVAFEDESEYGVPNNEPYMFDDED